MVISVAARKQKGRELQKWVCQQISKLTGFAWGKDCPIESRPMGQSGCDVRMESKVLKLFPFSVECKRQESWSIPNWIKQAKSNEMTGTSWIIVARSSRQEPIVIMDAEKFFALLDKPKEKEIIFRRRR